MPDSDSDFWSPILKQLGRPLLVTMVKDLAHRALPVCLLFLMLFSAGAIMVCTLAYDKPVPRDGVVAVFIILAILVLFWGLCGCILYRRKLEKSRQRYDRDHALKDLEMGAPNEMGAMNYRKGNEPAQSSHIAYNAEASWAYSGNGRQPGGHQDTPVIRAIRQEQFQQPCQQKYQQTDDNQKHGTGPHNDQQGFRLQETQGQSDRLESYQEDLSFPGTPPESVRSWQPASSTKSQKYQAVSCNAPFEGDRATLPSQWQRRFQGRSLTAGYGRASVQSLSQRDSGSSYQAYGMDHDAVVVLNNLATQQNNRKTSGPMDFAGYKVHFTTLELHNPFECTEKLRGATYFDDGVKFDKIRAKSGKVGAEYLFSLNVQQSRHNTAKSPLPSLPSCCRPLTRIKIKDLGAKKSCKIKDTKLQHPTFIHCINVSTENANHEAKEV